MRRQNDGVGVTIMEEYNMNIYDNALFLFCVRNKNRFKAAFCNSFVHKMTWN